MDCLRILYGVFNEYDDCSFVGYCRWPKFGKTQSMNQEQVPLLEKHELQLLMESSISLSILGQQNLSRVERLASEYMSKTLSIRCLIFPLFGCEKLACERYRNSHTAYWSFENLSYCLVGSITRKNGFTVVGNPAEDNIASFFKVSNAY
ncbi:hypothetical protein RF11_07659 [Thelohanellus kitauei]|uniref:Uncharacterized protein n=1 Tax=Thelohanellus kitauei TaxID=669202 RepID=A0A0C2MJL3_THEKT|nr:hypothetical protein RF11_07659 [Thelohanellus kitauei]